MKIGIFTDSHYSSAEITCGNRYNSRSLDKIKEAYDFFEREKCDLIICLGDLIDKEESHDREKENLAKVSAVMNESPIKTVCLMGNHDAFAFEKSEFYGLLQQSEPEILKKDNKTLIFIDACHFKCGRHYKPGDEDWTDTFYPYLDKLNKHLSEADGDVYVFIHQNLDGCVEKQHILYNADEINDIIFKSNRVKAVYQGHYHPGMSSNYRGVRYITFPAMCENEKAYYTEII